MRLRKDFDTYSDGLFSLPFNLPGTPFAKALKAREVIVEQIAQLVRAAQASMESGEKLDPKRRNSLQLLLDAQDENGEKVGLVLFDHFCVPEKALPNTCRQQLVDWQCVPRHWPTCISWHARLCSCRLCQWSLQGELWLSPL